MATIWNRTSAIAAVSLAAFSGIAPRCVEAAAAVPLYLVSGVADSTTAATVVHCSNLSSSLVTVWFEIYGPTGTEVCGVGAFAAAGSTVTIATRDTQLFVETGTCEFLPLIAKGLGRIGLDHPANVVCTVQLVDPAHATPLYLDRLSLYDENGNPKNSWLFADDFETTDTARWSFTSP